jgi:putative transposase
MGIARSSFYDQEAQERRLAKAREDARIQTEVERVQAELPATGYRMMLEYLRQRGIQIGERRLRRIMRENGLHAMIKRAWTKTTDSDHGYPVYRNLLPEMGVDGVNQVWVADITYIRIATRFVFLAVILDVYSRKVIGWALSIRIDAELTLAALRMAIVTRRPKAGCIHHSDRGVQYLCDEYVAELKKHGFHISHAAKGNPYENAFAETFMKTLKMNEVHLWEYETFEDVLERIPEFLERVYNRKRLHSALGYLSPEAFEKKWATKSNRSSKHKSEDDRPVLIL